MPRPQKSKKVDNEPNMVGDYKEPTLDNLVADMPSPESPGSVDNVFSQENLARTKEEFGERKEPKQRRKRRTTRVPKPEVTRQEIKQLLVPVFQMMSGVMESRGIAPLNEFEVQAGVDSWLPVMEHYLPKIGTYGIWIPPTLWTMGVIVMRLKSKEEPKKVEEPKK